MMKVKGEGELVGW